jgi:membrane-bound lytic murein transglycosylase D
VTRTLAFIFISPFIITAYVFSTSVDVGSDAFWDGIAIYSEELSDDTSQPSEPEPGRYPGKTLNNNDPGDGSRHWSQITTPAVYVAENKFVTRYVSRFQTTRRNDFSLWLSRAGKYLPLMRGILVENGLPEELVCLAMVESGFDPVALSEARAVGLWQFIPVTARRYGLRVDEWVDERKDPVKSTVAASRMLQDLYKKYSSWDLAIAAYNAGERRINRITTRSGCNEFWELAGSGNFNIETRYHVIKFNAAVLIMRDPDGHGFIDVELERPLLFESVDVPPGTHLRQIANLLNIEEIVLVDLNPQLIHARTPPDVTGYTLKVPFGMGETVRENLSARPIS